MKLIDVYHQEPDYVAWFEQNIKKPEIKIQIKRMKKYIEKIKLFKTRKEKQQC